MRRHPLGKQSIKKVKITIDVLPEEARTIEEMAFSANLARTPFCRELILFAIKTYKEKENDR